MSRTIGIEWDKPETSLRIEHESVVFEYVVTGNILISHDRGEIDFFVKIMFDYRDKLGQKLETVFNDENKLKILSGSDGHPIDKKMTIGRYNKNCSHSEILFNSIFTRLFDFTLGTYGDKRSYNALIDKIYESKHNIEKIMKFEYEEALENLKIIKWGM